MASLTVEAQTFKILHSFTASPSGTNSDGANPFAGLLLLGNTLYGTAYGGGTAGSGAIFKVNSDGTGFTNLHSFTAISNAMNIDGANPSSGLTLFGNALYGPTSGGTPIGGGAVFRINTDGTGFSNICVFNSNDGYCASELVLTNNLFYSSAFYGGGQEAGDLFQLSTDGTAFGIFYNFTGGSDGYTPNGLVFSGNWLYGTAVQGGEIGFYSGCVFGVNTSGTYTNLHSFGGVNDGANPQGILVLSGGTLYGVTLLGGTTNNGTVFKVNTDGTGYTNLYNFSTLTSGTNSDGAEPYTGLLLSGKILYGMTCQGGTNGCGTVFKINTDGTGFAILYNFTSPSSTVYASGINPHGALILSANTLYGTTEYSGAYSNGTVFALSLPLPSLNIKLYGNSAVLTWSDPTFSLQSAQAVGGVYTNVIGATSPFTNTITGQRVFYRLLGN
jgi:uncharacterized repeat protein (TIGR03803 family)